MPERPVFVVGYQRSGTTLMQSLLGRHSRIAAAPELYYWLRIHLLQDHLGDLADDRVLEQVVRRALDVPFGLWRDTAVEAAAVIERMGGGERTYAGLLRAVMEEFAATLDKPRWSEKTPGQQVAQCLEMVPEAQIVHIIRRPQDVIASNLEVPWHELTAFEIAATWRQFNLRAVNQGRRAGPASYLQVMYEDLVRDPRRVLEVVCTFLGEEFEERMLDAATSPAVPVIGGAWQGRAEERVVDRRGARTLKRWHQLQTLAAVRSTAAAFGYGLPGRRDRWLSSLALLASLPRRLAKGARVRVRRGRSSTPSGRAKVVDELVQARGRTMLRRGVVPMVGEKGDRQASPETRP